MGTETTVDGSVLAPERLVVRVADFVESVYEVGVELMVVAVPLELGTDQVVDVICAEGVTEGVE